MEAQLRNIGNSKGIILPKYLLEKYKFNSKVELIETDKGIMIAPLKRNTAFQEKLAEVKSKKYEIYNKMSEVAESDKAISYYKDSLDILDDIDLEIID